MKSILKYLMIALFFMPFYAMAQGAEVSCDDELQSIINLGTGIDADVQPLAPGVGVVDPYWRLTNLPVLSNCTDAERAALSDRAYVVNFNNSNSSSWVNQEGVSAISPVDAGTDGGLRCRQSPGDPFVFDRYFCLRAAAEIDLDVTFRGDDRLQLELVDINTELVLATSERYVYQNPPLAPFRFRVQLGLAAGTYALRAKFENDAVAAGFTVAGQVSMILDNAPPQLANAGTFPVFTCQRQDTLAADDYYYYPDSALTICIDPALIPASGPYTYQWYAPDGQLIRLAGDGDCYTIPVLDDNTSGTYYCQVQAVGSDVCYVLPVNVGTYVRDPTGAWAIPNQLVVKYRNDITEAEKQAYIDRIGATRLESCVCLVDLLQLPDSLFTMAGDTIIDPEEKIKKAGSKEDNDEIDESGGNTISSTQNLSDLPSAWKPAPLLLSPAKASTEVVVALIDTGFDFTDAGLATYIWQNPNPYPMDTEDCAVCLTGAERGYDFGDMDAMPDDQHGHGTNVGKAILQSLEALNGSSTAKVSIMPLKVMNDKEQITLFSLTCATVFAVKHGAQVINLSMGGYGGYQRVIAAALNMYAPATCPPLVVTSAGNDTSNNDVSPHYFSNLNDSLATALSVGAILEKEPRRAPYSNFGNKVDLGTTGKLDFNVEGSPEGTSIAAGHISGVLAYIRTQRPGISSSSAKNCLLSVAANKGIELPFWENSALTIDNLSWKEELLACLDNLPNEDCTYTFEPCILVNTKVSPRQREILRVSVVPNPNRGAWRFDFALDITQELQLSITDAQGKLIDQQRFRSGAGQHSIPYSLVNQPAGLYFYQIISEKYIYAGKIVKQGK